MHDVHKFVNLHTVVVTCRREKDVVRPAIE
jgi:hypothetical protein